MISSNSQPLGGGDPLFVSRHSTMTRPNMMGAVPMYKEQYPSAATANSFPLSGAAGAGGVSTFPTSDATKTAYGRRDAPPVPNTWKQHPNAVPRSYYPQRQSQVNFLPTRFDFNHAAADEASAATNAFADWHTSAARHVSSKDTNIRQAPRSYRYGPPVPATDRGYGAYTQPIAAPRIEAFGGSESGVGVAAVQAETEAENVQSVWSMNAEQLASRQPQKQPGMTHTEFPTPGEIQQALSVAGEFAYHYFHLMQTEPGKLHCFYSTDSQLAHGSSVWEHTKWHRAIGESDIERLFDSVLASKMEGGNSLIVRSNVKTIEAQPTRDGGLVMQATGIIETRDLGSRPFAHTIVMNKAHNEGSYVVLHDIFVFLDDVLQLPPTVPQSAFIPSATVTRSAASATQASVSAPPPPAATVAATSVAPPQMEMATATSQTDPQMIPPLEPPCINNDLPASAAGMNHAPQEEEQGGEIDGAEMEEAELEDADDEEEEEVETVEEEEEEEEEEEGFAPAEEEAAAETETEERAREVVSLMAEEGSIAVEEETSMQHTEIHDADVIGVSRSGTSSRESSSSLSAAEGEKPTEEEEEDQPDAASMLRRLPPSEERAPGVALEGDKEELVYATYEESKTVDVAKQPEDLTKALIEEPPSAAPVNPWRRDEAEDDNLSLPEDEEEDDKAAPVVVEEAPVPQVTGVEEEAAPRQSAWKTIHRQPPAAPPIPVAQPEVIPKAAAPVVQRQVVPERTQHELPVSLSNHEPNSYVAKLMCGLSNPPPVRGHVLKRSDESASTSPSTREHGGQEDVSGYPCKAVWISQLETFTDAQIEYAVSERLKGCPTEGRVIRIERMRNGPAGMIELDSEDCVPLLLERGLCINGIEVRIDLYKQTPSQIVREPSGSKLQQAAPRRGGGGRGRSQPINRDGPVEEETTQATTTSNSYRGRGWQGPSRGGNRGGNRGGMRGGAVRSDKPVTTQMSSTEEIGGDWEVAGRSSRRTKSGVHQ